MASLILKEIPLNTDDMLQKYTDVEDLALAIDKYDEHFGIDVSMLNIENYYP